MEKYFNNIFDDQKGCLRKKIISIYSLLILYNVFVWLWEFYFFHHNPLLLSTALLAYTFGLRHAMDADHNNHQHFYGELDPFCNSVQTHAI